MDAHGATDTEDGYSPSEYWSRVAERVRARGDGQDWDLAGDQGPFHRYKRAHAVRRLENLGVAGRSVLELGPGPGGNLQLLRELGARELIGCDIAPEMIAIARRNLGDDVDLRLLDGPSLPLGDRSVDISLTVTVLQHNPDDAVRSLIAELARVTRHRIELIEDTTTFRPRSPTPSYHVRDVTTYIALLTAHGFALEEVEYMNVWASERTALAIRRIGGLLARRAYREGDTLSSLELALERATLPLTKQLDSCLPPLTGNAAMRFRRIAFE